MNARRSHEADLRHGLIVELLSGGASMAETATAIGVSKSRLYQLCQNIVLAGQRRGIPASSMKSILFPRPFGMSGDVDQTQKYSSMAVSIESVQRLRRWEDAAFSVAAAQEELSIEGLVDLAELIQVGPPPRPIYMPNYKTIIADNFIFVHESGFRIAAEEPYWTGRSWDGTKGFIPEIQGYIDLDEVLHLINTGTNLSQALNPHGEVPQEFSFIIRLSEDLNDPGSQMVFHRGCGLGFAPPTGYETEFVNSIESVKARINHRRRRILIQINHSYVETSNNTSNPISYEMIK